MQTEKTKILNMYSLAHYDDLKRSMNNRVISVEINGKPLDIKKLYKVGTQSFLAQGGDLYKTFSEVKYRDTKINLSEVVINFIKEKEAINLPNMGRMKSIQRK